MEYSRLVQENFRNLPPTTHTSVRVHIFALGAIGFLLMTAVYFTPPVIRTIRSKDELAPEVRRIHLFFIGIEKMLRSGR